MGKLDGHCLCGQVSYTVDDGTEPIMTGICHCTECRRQSGSAWSCVVGVDEDAFHISGDPLKSYETIGTDTNQPVDRQFCSNCGSPLVSRPAWSEGTVWIKAGTLNDPSWLEPELEAWTDSALPWSGKDESNEERGFFPRGLDTEGDEDEALAAT